MRALSSYRFARTVGTVLTGEALLSAAELRMPGQTASDYQLPPGMTVNAAIARAWDAMLAAHREWHKALAKLPSGDAATKVTRDKWLLPLLYELGWGRVDAVSGGLSVDPGLGETTAPHFPVSHRWSFPDAASPSAWVPLHLIGAGVELDTRTASVTARAPQSMLQDYLNREPRALWAILSNGRKLRLLRDASALARQSYVEFDLDEIFTNQLYADFRLLFLAAHATRFAPRLTDASRKSAATPDIEDAPKEFETQAARLDNCWLERWRIQAIDVGSRARLNLQHGIARALELLGNGFLICPENRALREALANTHDADRDLHRALLRIAYRLIVLFVVEQRGLLQTADVADDARKRYANYFSTGRLRDLAATHAGSRHTDLWEAHQMVTDALAGDGLPELGVSGLGASLFSRDFLGILSGARLPNHAFLAAVKELSYVDDPLTGTARPVDFLNLDSEEFGGMYEGLLAYMPRYDPSDHSFTLALTAGSERKKSGSYYTPSDLIDLVLSEALDPLIDEALKKPTPDERETALLNLTVVDPACGSGHFVVAAARRIGIALAQARTGETEPAPTAVRRATADVIDRCIYGVDLNDLALEITKAALWLEAFDASRPFPFLDSHFRLGNALLGTTPALLEMNIPDAAFVALTGDNRDWTAKLKARNKSEREAGSGQLTLDIDLETINVETAHFHKAAQEADAGSVVDLSNLRLRADAWRKLFEDPDLRAAKLVADAWCAAFVQPKESLTTSGPGITHATLRDLSEHPDAAPDSVVKLVEDLARQYRFFHWHLEFPGIFTVETVSTDDSGPGWSGGFSCVIGNPPWERVKVQEPEFFKATGHPEIAAESATPRRKLIARLADEDPPLYAAYQRALREADATSCFLRSSGRYPLAGVGRDINTASVFLEASRTTVGRDGTVGLVLPSGIATDDTTKELFADMASNGYLRSLHDFDNRRKIFPDVHSATKFSVLTVAGTPLPDVPIRFTFFNSAPADARNLDRVIALSSSDIALINPNTRTAPVFRSRRHAEITLAIYRRHPVLHSMPGDDHWGFRTRPGLFHMGNDESLFHAEQEDNDVRLYEAKMAHIFDHRWANIDGSGTASQRDDPCDFARPRSYVDNREVQRRLGEPTQYLTGFRDVSNATNERTLLPLLIPAVGAGHNITLYTARQDALMLLACFASMACDFVARVKLGGTHMSAFVVRQLPIPRPEAFDEPAAWERSATYREWLTPRVHELTYTAWDLALYADSLNDHLPPFHWNDERRALIKAELDAAMFQIYGMEAEAVEFALDDFPTLRRNDERNFGEYRTKRLVLAAYDRMEEAIALGGKGWKPLADPPAGAGPRHRDRT